MAWDYTKYNVEDLGKKLNKRNLVFTVVKDWVEKNNPSFEELQNTFPDEVQGGKGYLRRESEVTDPKRFNMREPLKIMNGAHVVVSNQCGENLPRFIELAKSLKYKISIAGLQIESTEETFELEISMEVLSAEVYGEHYGDFSFVGKVNSNLLSIWESEKVYKSLTNLINAIISDNIDEIIDRVQDDTNLLSEMEDPNFDWFSLSPHLRVISFGGTDISALCDVDGNEEYLSKLLGVEEDEVEDYACDVRVDIHYSISRDDLEQ